MSTPIYKRFEKFVKDSKQVHGDKYIYDLAHYVNAKTPMEIGCPEHGTFSQMPTVHLRGYGCPGCGNVRDLRSFIQKATAKHDGKYDYSKTIYTGTLDKVLIECPEHGQFKQVAKDHLAGCGCIECDGTYKIDRNEFIRRAHTIHGDTYDYSPTVYRGDRIKVDIICHYHGVFSQRPNAHLRGQGCRRCGKVGKLCETIFQRSPKLRESPGIFYIMKFSGKHEKFLKVGITQVTPQKRAKYWSGYTVEILREHPMTIYQAFKLERMVLLNLTTMTPKIKFGGYTECLPVDQLAKINDIVDKKFYLA